MQSSRFKPNIFTLGTVFTPGFDELPGGNHPASMLLQTGSGDPSRRMFRIGFDKGVKEHSSPLDVTDLGFGLDGYAVERCKVSFGIDGSRYSGRRARHLVQFK